MATTELDCIVWGDEPAGVWLLKALSEQSEFPMKLGYVKGQGSACVVMAANVAATYNLSVGQRWHFELVFPKTLVDWTYSRLENELGSLAFLEEWEPSPALTAQQTRALKSLLFRYPELYCKALGIWKWIGRSWPIPPEDLLFWALQYSQSVNWEPSQDVNKINEKACVFASDDSVKSIESTGHGIVSLQLSDSDRWTTRNLIINLSPGQLRSKIGLLGRGLKDLGDAFSPKVVAKLYRMQIVLDKSVVTKQISPLAIFFDSEESPDWGTEINPVEFISNNDELMVNYWATAPSDGSIEFITDRFRHGLKRLNQQNPFFFRSIRMVTPSLDVDTCHGLEFRVKTSREIEINSREIYQTSSLHAYTRPGILVLSPHVFSHLPYPLGPLQAVKETYKHLLRAKSPGASQRFSKSLRSWSLRGK